MSITCCRPVAVAISISWWANAAPPCRATRIDIEVRVKGDIDNGAIYPSLKDRVVFISGGGSGIGECLVEHFSAQASRVTFVDLAEQPCRALVARIAAKGQRPPDFIPCDLRRIEDLRAAISATQGKHGPIRVLVNNAGNDDRHRTEDVTVDYWDERMAVNLRHQFFATQAVRPQMRDAGGGSIVNFGSITWLVGDSDCPAFVSAQAATTGPARPLSAELGPVDNPADLGLPGLGLTR